MATDDPAPSEPQNSKDPQDSEDAHDAAQREAGLLAAAAACEERFGIHKDDFTSGMASVRGAMTSAGGRHLTVPDPDVPEDVGAAAFFDVDNTLIQGSSLAQLALGMARKRILRLSDIGPIVWKQVKYMLSGAENAADVASSREQALSFVKGRRIADLIEVGEEIVDDKMLSKTYAGTRSLAQMHVDAGEQVWLVTATPVQLAQILADRLGFTGALGTVAEVDDGILSGRLTGDILHGPGKAHAVAALAALEGLDLQRCTAYSDSANDLPLLTMVGTAVAINPDSTLKKEAKKRGWEIRDYRSVRSSAKWVILALAVASILLAGMRRAKR